MSAPLSDADALRCALEVLPEAMRQPGLVRDTAFEALGREIARLRGERDEARSHERAAVADWGGNVSLNLECDQLRAELAACRAALDAIRIQAQLDFEHRPGADQSLIAVVTACDRALAPAPAGTPDPEPR